MTFTSNGETREFEIRKVFWIRDEAVFMKLMNGCETLQDMATSLFRDESKFDSFMRSAMIGDHEGWNRYDVEERKEVGEAIAESLRFFFNIGSDAKSKSGDSRKNSQKKGS